MLASHVILFFRSELLVQYTPSLCLSHNPGHEGVSGWDRGGGGEGEGAVKCSGALMPSLVPPLGPGPAARGMEKIKTKYHGGL